MKYFVGGEGTFDYSQSPLFIDELANIRGAGGAVGPIRAVTRGSAHAGFILQWMPLCGQINILMALTDIGPGDGATMVIPGSHKAHFDHPQLAEHAIGGAKQSATT